MEVLAKKIEHGIRVTGDAISAKQSGIIMEMMHRMSWEACRAEPFNDGSDIRDFKQIEVKRFDAAYDAADKE